MYHIALALAKMGAAAQRLQCLFITIDPARDTPAAASRYARLFSPDIIGLSGTPAQVAQAMQAYHVYAAPADAQGDEITHSDFIYLVAPGGSFIAAFPGTLAANTLAARITSAMGNG
jgi:protein SCO1/2